MLNAVTMTLANNQIEITSALDSFGACQYLGSQSVANDATMRHAILEILRNPDRPFTMSTKAFSLVDGLGVDRLCVALGY